MSFADSEKFTINYWSKPEYSISKKFLSKTKKTQTLLLIIFTISGLSRALLYFISLKAR